MTIRSTEELLERAVNSSPIPTDSPGAAATRLPSFLGDRSVPQMLHAAVLRSPFAHARIVSINLDAARSLSGVHCVLAADDLPTEHCFGIVVHDRPPLARKLVRHIGEPIVAVAADTVEQARAAIEQVQIRFEPLPVLGDLSQALASDAVSLHPGGNLLHQRQFARGDFSRVFDAGHIVIENRLRTGHQAHNYLELECALAIPAADGSLHVLGPCQGPHAIQLELARMLGWPEHRIKVTGSPLGGSYGGKDEIHAQAIAALLAVRVNRPVRFAWRRADHMNAGIKRHPFDIKLRSSCTADGRLLGLEVQMQLDTGAYASHGPEVLDTAVEHAAGPYAWQALRIDGKVVYTNNGIAGAFRGFGALQINCALEMQIDELARRSGIDPIEFRRRNLQTDRHLGPLGQRTAPFPDLLQVLEHLKLPPRTEPAHQSEVANQRFVESCGVALIVKSEGFAKGGPNGASGRLGYLGQGKFELRVGLADMGQGIEHAARSLLIERLQAWPGFDPARLQVSLGSTLETPAAGPTAASRGTPIVARLIDELCRQLLEGLEFSSKEVWTEAAVLMPETVSEYGPAHATFGACAASAKVRIDRWTGQVRVIEVQILPSVGPVVHPMGFLTQIEGSVPMALGYVLTERLTVEEGRFSANNLDSYLLPTRADLPKISVLAFDAPSAPDDALPRGIGEIALNAIAAAIANAVAGSVGAMVPRLPVSPAWLREQLDARFDLEGNR